MIKDFITSGMHSFVEYIEEILKYLNTSLIATSDLQKRLTTSIDEVYNIWNFHCSIFSIILNSCLPICLSGYSFSRRILFKLSKIGIRVNPSIF